jgi:hypothetical protein
MKDGVRGLVGVIFVALLCFALPAFGQNTNINFNGGFQGGVWCGGSDGCVGTGDYDGTINGVNVGPGGSAPGMICDDYNHNITAGQSWTANGIDAANLNSSNIGATQFGNAIGIGGYTELAWLVTQMFGTSNSSTQSALSQAIWYITGGVSWAQIGSTAQGFVNQVMALYNNGHGSISLSQFANLFVYTPTDQTMNGPQEMWSEVAVAEGGTALLYLLLAGAVCFAAMFHSRKQRAKRTIA